MDEATPIRPDLLINNVTVWAGDRPRPEYGWLAVKDGRIHATGGHADAPPESQRCIDAQGKVDNAWIGHAMLYQACSESNQEQKGVA